MADVARLLHPTELLIAPDAPKFKSRRLWAYLSAGSWIMRAPDQDFDRDLWKKLLVQPLGEIVVEGPATNVGKIASEILARVTEAMAKHK
jgi:hypothetical protein